MIFEVGASLGRITCNTFASGVVPSTNSALEPSIIRRRSFRPLQLSKFRFEIVAVRILKKPSELSVGDGFACHSSPSAIKTFSSQAIACCEP